MRRARHIQLAFSNVAVRPGSGEFAWQPGVVTQAVADGRWLLIEDVDRAPLEVTGRSDASPPTSPLAPTLTRMRTCAPAHGR